MNRIRVKKMFTLLLLTSLFFLFSSLKIDATTSGSNIINDVDYSGQGTIIEKTIRNSQAYNDSSYAYIPTYGARYENQKILINDWYLHSWSSWSTKNNRTNNYDDYRGESIIEYDVQSKKQYQYKVWDPEMGVLVGTMYVTKYKGSKWYNSFLTKTIESTEGYPGNISNYKIVDQYIYGYVKGYEGGYINDYTWHDDAPSGSDKILNTRTVYRYRSRTITWNNKAYSSIETVPLNYSFSDVSGNSLGIIKWELMKEVSNYEDTASSVNVSYYQYFIKSTDIIDLLETAIEKKVEDALMQTTFSDFGDIVLYAIGSGVTYVNPTLGGAIGLATFVIDYIDSSIIYKMAANEINTIQDFIDELQSSKETAVISFANITVNTGNMYSETLIYQTDSVNIDYVSMNYKNNQISNNLVNFEGNNYGKISYLTSIDEVVNHIKLVLRESHPTLVPWDTIYLGD